MKYTHNNLKIAKEFYVYISVTENTTYKLGFSPFKSKNFD